MTDSTIVEITDRARGVLALEVELSAVVREIEDERRRHNDVMSALLAKEHAIENAIFQLGSNNGR